MSTVTRTITETVEKKVSMRVSDFSGIEIPKLNWGTVTNIWCTTSDHGNKHGNIGTVFDLELRPEEMKAFKEDLHKLIEQHKRKWMSRTTEVGR